MILKTEALTVAKQLELLDFFLKICYTISTIYHICDFSEKLQKQ